VAGSDKIGSPGGIFIDRHNTLFIADQYNDRIIKQEYGTTNATVFLDGLYYPADLFIDSKGTMFIAEKETLTRWPKDSRNGTVLGRSDWYISVTIDPKEEYLYTTEYGHNRVKKYTVNGRAEQNGTEVIPNVNSRKFFLFAHI
jgi:hypothetical protein